MTLDAAWSEAMPPQRKKIALVFPPVGSYGRKVTEGVVERHLVHREWSIIEVPRLIQGKTPFPNGHEHLDGIILWAEAFDDWVHDLIKDGVPVVNCGMEWVGVDGVVSVHLNHDEMHDAVIGHFLTLGLKRAVVIGHRLLQRPVTNRVVQAFATAAQEAGMEARVWELDGKDSPGLMPNRLLETDREEKLAEMLMELPKPTGIFCFGDHIGFIVCEVAARLGIRVPEDLAIVGMGDNLVTNFANPPLSSVAGNPHAVGCEAADCLARWLEAGSPPFLDLSIPGATLVERESTVGMSGNVILEGVRRFISLHATNGVSLGELVEISGLSVKTLVRKYREAFGLDPAEDVLQRRLGEARRLLGESDLPIAEVARICGFASQSAFVNFFQRHAGSSPGKYRTADIEPKA